MPASGGWTASTLLTVVAAWAIGQVTQPDGAELTRDTGPKLQVDAGPPRAGGVQEAGVVLALGGRRLSVQVRGQAAEKYTWQFGLRGIVSSRGELALDRSGLGRFDIELPDVRARTECWLVLAGRANLVRRMEVAPAASLGIAAKRIADIQLGVLDGSGGVPRALEAEKAPFDGLTTTLLADAFDGGVILLAGFKQAEELADACRRLQGRIEDGMIAVILDPPAEWRGWGLSIEKLAAPATGAAGLDGALGQVLRPSDLDGAAWRRVLRVDSPWRPLAWVQVVEPNQRDSPPARQALLAARAVGKGQVCVSILWQRGDPLVDAADRMVLDELVLWAVAQHLDKQRLRGEQR